jgi:hypothetical protein
MLVCHWWQPQPIQRPDTKQQLSYVLPVLLKLLSSHWPRLCPNERELGGEKV